MNAHLHEIKQMVVNVQMTFSTASFLEKIQVTCDKSLKSGDHWKTVVILNIWLYSFKPCTLVA